MNLRGFLDPMNQQTGEVSPSGTELRAGVLDEVHDCVCLDRQNSYGDAEDNFANIATVANIMLGRKLKEPLTALDVAAFSLAIKVARMASSPEHKDNWIDAAGYAVCGAGILRRQELNTVEGSACV